MKPHVTRDRKEMFKDNKYTHTVCVNQVFPVLIIEYIPVFIVFKQ